MTQSVVITYSEDTTPPTVQLENYNNNSIVLEEEFALECNASDGGGLVNISLYSDMDGSFGLDATNSLTGYANSSVFYQNLSDYYPANTFVDTTVNWNCYAYDTAGYSAFASTNNSFSSFDLGSYTNVSLNSTDDSITLVGSNLTGIYESRIFNATYPADWLNLTWDETISTGNNLTVQARSCSTSSCTENYELNCTDNSLCDLSSLSQNDYFQYRIIFRTNDTRRQ